MMKVRGQGLKPGAARPGVSATREAPRHRRLAQLPGALRRLRGVRVTGAALGSAVGEL